MAAKDPAKKPKDAATKPAKGFTDDERAAMRARNRELQAEARAGKADLEAETLAAIAAMPDADRAMAERLHALVKANAPGLAPKTWYGMPAYAKDGKVVCFFQGAYKFKARYATVGFSDNARLDDGAAWPTSFAVTAWTPEVEARLAALVTRAVG